MGRLDHPPVGVIIPTYNRRDILLKTISNLMDNINYPYDVRYFVGIDGPYESIAEPLQQTFPTVKIIRGPNRGHGANMNVLIQAAAVAGCPVMLSLDDDHWMIKPHDITPHVEKLMNDATVGAIRLMGIAGHHYHARLDEMYWRINWSSPELYITSHRPHLKHIRFHEAFGFYPENLKLGLTEETFCHTAQDKALSGASVPEVLIPLENVSASGWDHVGDSYQLKGF